jgi:hypothetical protein
MQGGGPEARLENKRKLMVLQQPGAEVTKNRISNDEARLGWKRRR